VKTTVCGGLSHRRAARPALEEPIAGRRAEDLPFDGASADELMTDRRCVHGRTRSWQFRQSSARAPAGQDARRHWPHRRSTPVVHKNRRQGRPDVAGLDHVLLTSDALSGLSHPTRNHCRPLATARLGREGVNSTSAECGRPTTDHRHAAPARKNENNRRETSRRRGRASSHRQRRAVEAPASTTRIMVTIDARRHRSEHAELPTAAPLARTTRSELWATPGPPVENPRRSIQTRSLS